MSERICYLCGKPATGFASVWTRATGDRPYCHGDDDPTPTCYERADRPAGDGLYLLEALLADIAKPTTTEGADL